MAAVRFFCGGALVAASAWAQAGSGLQRDGDVWVETLSGSIVAGNATAVRVDSSGPVSFEGDGGGNLVYTLRRSVRAGSEADARRMLARAGEFRTWRSGQWLHLSAMRGVAGPEVATQIRVKAPRWMRQTVVQTAWGPVEAVDLQGALVASTGGGIVRVDRVVGSVELRTGGGEIVLGSVRGTVRAVTGGGTIRVRESGGEAWLESGGGEIVVEDSEGPVIASTMAGNVDIGKTRGWVRARTNGGMIRVQEAGGEVTAESAGGPISIGSARGVRCESASGAVKLGRVAGEMRVATGMGSILAQLLSGMPLANSYLSTTSGDVTVMIPSNLAVTVDAMTESLGRMARIVSDFSEIRVGDARAASGAARAVRASGALNGGGPVLRVAARDGVIYLRRVD